VPFRENDYRIAFFHPVGQLIYTFFHTLRYREIVGHAYHRPKYRRVPYPILVNKMSLGCSITKIKISKNDWWLAMITDGFLKSASCLLMISFFTGCP
jgi:hypothetical protein